MPGVSAVVENSRHKDSTLEALRPDIGAKAWPHGSAHSAQHIRAEAIFPAIVFLF